MTSTPDLRPGVRIAWSADGFSAIRMTAPGRPRAELDAFASGVADDALVNRDLQSLTAALRRRFGGTFDVDEQQPGTDPGGGPDEPFVLVRLHPPRGTPNPDPGG